MGTATSGDFHPDKEDREAWRAAVRGGGEELGAIEPLNNRTTKEDPCYSSSASLLISYKWRVGL